MRTILLANNRLGAMVAAFLAERGDLAAVILHPPETGSSTATMRDLGTPSWIWPDGLDAAEALRPQCLLSVLFGYVLPDAWLALPSWRAVNLHPGYLPWNRGSAPNAWPLVDGSPAGTTLHVMTAGIDRGPILVQRQIEVRPEDTAETLYRRLENASLDLLTGSWAGLSEIEPVEQPDGGSSHRMSDLDDLDPVTEQEFAFLDRLRARTFPPYGAEFERGGQRYRVRVEIEPLC